MPDQLRKHGAAYAVAFAAVVLASVARWLLAPLLGDRLPYFTFYFAVIAAAWYGGLGPGLLSLALGFLTANYFFAPPRFAFDLADQVNQLDAFRFAAVGVCVSIVCGRLLVKTQQVLDQQVQLEQEVAERRRAEEETRRQRDWLHVTLASIGDAVIATDAVGNVTFLNPVAEELTGWRQAEATGRLLDSVFKIVNEETRRPVETPVQKVLQEGRVVGLANHTVLIAKDGSERPIDDSAAPIRDEKGSVVGVVLVFRDVSGRKGADETLRKQSERQRLLWEAAAVLLTTEEPDAMLRGLFAKLGPHFKLDTYFNFMVNDAGDALRLESCIGVPDETVRSIQRLEFGQAICGTVALRRQPIVAEHIQESDDPKAQLVKSFGIRVYACNPLLTDDELLGTLSFASRSRDQFDAEEVEFLRTISHYVTVAYERLRLVAALREADRRKDEFLAVLAHELRNPLAPIRNALQIMSLAGDNAEAVGQARSLMERQVGQMVRLIDDLLDVSRITRGKLELRKQPVELKAVVESAVEACRPLVEQLQHRFTVSLPPKPVMLEGDPTRLAQVVSNLLNNAAKFMEAGGDIRLTAEVEGSDVVLRVKDTGMGISPDALPRLFQMFMQADRSLEKTHGGLGIGLNLAKRLTEMHGGSIAARSEGVGKGSEFIVRLPVLIAAGLPQPRVADKDGIASGIRLRILVADDNHDAANTLAAMLRIMGHEVRIAHDGQQAVSTAFDYQPDVAILDIGMPRLNGYDAAQAIKRQQQDVLLVALTGWGQEDDKRRSQESGFDYHLTKPADPILLGKILAAVKPLPV